MEKQIIIIAEEFPSHSGGVAYFSDVLAKQYHTEKRLKGLISLSPHAAEKRDFPVIHAPYVGRSYGSMPLDHLWLPRKLNSFLFKTYNTITGRSWKQVVKALRALDYNAKTDILFFTYQVHQANLFEIIYRKFKGEQWMLYHGLDLIGFQKFPKPVNYVSQHAAKLIFNSKATQSLFAELGFSTEQPQEVVYPFLDKAHLERLSVYSVEELEALTKVHLKEAIVVTSICRLVKRKGIHFAIAMVADLIKDKGLNIQYFIGGTGPEQEFLKTKVQELGLSDHIHFLGYIDEVLKYSLLNQSKVFLMPNYDDGGGDFEGFGISFLEAGYYGNHVVAGHHGGAVEAMKFIDRYNLINVHNKTDLQLIVNKLNTVLRPHAN